MARKHITLLVIVASLIAVGIAVTLLFFTPKKAISPDLDEAQSNQQETKQETKEEKTFPVVDVQPVIDQWGAQQTGEFSIVVYDLENRLTVGSYQPDKSYFAASIYKLYVAYEGWLQIAQEEVSPTDPFLNGQTREQCLDAMIRSSDSPCAEKLWSELGKEATTEKLKTYDINNTSMTSITTTAQDAATLLIRLFEQKELPEAITVKYLDSMKTQDALYRRGLPSGFQNATVYNKVGWNGLKEWHDTAIVSFPNNRNYVIALFTENVGTSQIRQLAASLESALTTNEN